MVNHIKSMYRVEHSDIQQQHSVSLATDIYALKDDKEVKPYLVRW